MYCKKMHIFHSNCYMDYKEVEQGDSQVNLMTAMENKCPTCKAEMMLMASSDAEIPASPNFLAGAPGSNVSI